MADTTQPRHIVTIGEAREAGARASMATWDYTRTLLPGVSLSERARRAGWAALGSLTFISGSLKSLKMGGDLSLLCLALGLKGVQVTYYELRDFSAELLSQVQSGREIARLKRSPRVYTRVCKHCGGSSFGLVHEAYNLLLQRYSRRCDTCGRNDTAILGGPDPLMWYNGRDVTEHMDFFGVADNRLVLGVRTAPGLGSDDEYAAVRRLVLG